MEDLVDRVELANWRKELSYWTKQIDNCDIFIMNALEMLTSTIFVPKYLPCLKSWIRIGLLGEKDVGSRKDNKT